MRRKVLFSLVLVATMCPSSPAWAWACGDVNHVPSATCLQNIQTLDRESSGDLAVVVADCNAPVPAAAAGYADFWRLDTMCSSDWDQGWGNGSSNAAACDDTTAFGTFIKTVWLMEHAHPSHPNINPRDIDPESDKWTTGDERWLIEGGNYLRDKIRWGGRFFAPVNGGDHIALTLPEFQMQLYCDTWFQQNVVLRASTLIHEARHHDAGTVHCYDAADVIECHASLPCPDGNPCDPDLAYKGSYWFQISWLESFHRFADQTKTTYAMRAIARDGANWLAQNRLEDNGGYFLDDTRNHTRYRSSYVSSMFPRTVDIAAAPQYGEAKVMRERCGSADSTFTDHLTTMNAMGNGAMTLTSSSWGRKDLLWYGDGWYGPALGLGGTLAERIFHLEGEDEVSPRVDADLLCQDGNAALGNWTSLGINNGSPGPFMRKSDTPLWPGVMRHNPVRTVEIGSDALVVMAIEYDSGASGPLFDRKPLMFVKRQDGWDGYGTTVTASLAGHTEHPSFVAHHTSAGGPLFTPLGVSWGPDRVDIFAVFDDMRIRRRFCNGCGTDLKAWDFQPNGDWEDVEPANPITMFWGFDAVSWGEGRIDLVTDSVDGNVYHRAWNEGQGEENWASLGNGGGFLVNPVAVTVEYGALDVFAIDFYTGHVMRKHLRAGLGWGPVSKASDEWEDLGKPFSGATDFDSLAAVTTGNGDIEVFLRASQSDESQRHLVHRRVKPAAAPQGVCFMHDDCEPDFAAWSSFDSSKFPGSATDISIGTRAERPWVVGTSGRVFEWYNGAWVQRDSQRFYSAIDVGEVIGSGSLQVGVATNAAIWKREGGTWSQMPGGAIDVGVGANGDIWVVGTSKRLFRWNGAAWDLMRSGDHIAVDVGPDGTVYVIDAQNQIIELEGGNPAAATVLPGRALDVSVSSDGEVWVVGTSKKLFRLDGGNWTSVHDVSGSRLAAGPDGYVGYVSTNNSIFVY